ncbi:MAG: hypothetical protein JWQ81_5334 [Amycolatopsis sp.]|nr:hypothetical protein [Amycolatopsis sp.]
MPRKLRDRKSTASCDVKSTANRLDHALWILVELIFGDDDKVPTGSKEGSPSSSVEQGLVVFLVPSTVVFDGELTFRESQIQPAEELPTVKDVYLRLRLHAIERQPNANLGLGNGLRPRIGQPNRLAGPNNAMVVT